MATTDASAASCEPNSAAETANTAPSSSFRRQMELAAVVLVDLELHGYLLAAARAAGATSERYVPPSLVRRSTSERRSPSPPPTTSRTSGRGWFSIAHWTPQRQQVSAPLAMGALHCRQTRGR
jgi:hypothetical protein